MFSGGSEEIVAEEGEGIRGEWKKCDGRNDGKGE